MVMSKLYKQCAGVLISFFAIVSIAGADYPPDVQSFTGRFSGNTTQTIISGATTTSPYTILAIRMQQEKDLSTTILRCGTKELAYNWAKDYTIDLLQTKCIAPVEVVKTGNDQVFISIMYLARDYSLEPDRDAILASASYNKPIPVYNSMTAGDIVLIIMLFAILMLGFIKLFLDKI